MSQKAKTIAAALLLSVLGIVVIFQARDDRTARKAADRAAARTAGPRAATDPAADVPVIAHLAFRPRLNETFERERSLFAYAKSPATLAAERRAAEEAAEAARKAAEERERLRKEQEERDREARKIADAKAAEAAARQAQWLKDNPPKPVPPDFPYEFVGIIGPADRPLAILEDRAHALVYAGSGDVVDNAFRLERVGRKALDFSYVNETFKDQFKRVQLVSKPGLDLSSSTPAAASRPSKRR